MSQNRFPPRFCKKIFRRGFTKMHLHHPAIRNVPEKSHIEYYFWKKEISVYMYKQTITKDTCCVWPLAEVLKYYVLRSKTLTKGGCCFYIDKCSNSAGTNRIFQKQTKLLLPLGSAMSSYEDITICRSWSNFMSSPSALWHLFCRYT
jgi:hypothetical protein